MGHSWEYPMPCHACDVSIREGEETKKKKRKKNSVPCHVVFRLEREYPPRLLLSGSFFFAGCPVAPTCPSSRQSQTRKRLAALQAASPTEPLPPLLPLTRSGARKTPIPLFSNQPTTNHSFVSSSLSPDRGRSRTRRPTGTS